MSDARNFGQNKIKLPQFDKTRYTNLVTLSVTNSKIKILYENNIKTTRNI